MALEYNLVRKYHDMTEKALTSDCDKLADEMFNDVMSLIEHAAKSGFYSVYWDDAKRYATFGGVQDAAREKVIRKLRLEGFSVGNWYPVYIDWSKVPDPDTWHYVEEE